MANKKIRTAIIASALIGCMAIGGISAYFTDADTATNTFTVGKVEIDLKEPNWDPEDVEDILPNEEITKDPQVENVGPNDAFIFVEVEVPVAEVKVASDAGVVTGPTKTQLFTWEANDEWFLVNSDTTGADVYKYVYAYGTETAMTAVSNGTTTEAVFETVKFANIVEDQNFEGEDLTMVVNAYAIQTTDINNGVTAPADVWLVVKNQAPATAKSGEDAKTDEY